MIHEITIPIGEYDYLRECKKAIEGLNRADESYFVITYDDGHFFSCRRLLEHGQNPEPKLMLMLAQKDREKIELNAEIKYLREKNGELKRRKWYQLW